MPRRLIGRHKYLTNNRPNITFYVQKLSQFLDKPTITHYNVAIRVLKYIKGALNLGLFFSSCNSVHLKTFCYSDWDTYSDSRKSVTDFLVCILETPIYLGNQISKEQYQRERVPMKLNTGQ